MFNNSNIGYDFPPYRPPNEANSALIRVSRGCPWNKCLFCTMYKTCKFTPRSIDDIKQDICSKFWISNNFRFAEVFMESLDDIKSNEYMLKTMLKLDK